MVAQIANSSDYPNLHPKHPPATLAPITFLSLDGLVVYAKLSGISPMFCDLWHK